jgi:hypothetical protein
LPAAGAEGAAAHLGTHVWREGWDGFGGFSAIAVAADGLGFLALSDRSLLVEGRLLRDAAGLVVGVETLARRPLLDADGQPLRPPRSDSEGLAVGPDGTVFVAFEGLARVRREGRDGAPPATLPHHPAFERVHPNRSLEALAIGPDGALYTAIEGDERRRLRIWRLSGDAWEVALRLPRTPGLAPVGADIGPDGRLYLLERGIGALGFRSRLRRADLDGSAAQTLFETAPGTHDNLEGVSVWQDRAGLCATMISDDNFRFFQRTEIVEYRLPD